MRHLLLLLLPFSMACSLTALSTPSPSAEAPPTYTGLGLDALDAYHATFEIRFTGASEWTYHLETRTDGDLVEYSLHMEGVDVAHNPGDLRVVIENEVARMRGPGTDDECLQFPSDLALGPSFLTPDDLVDPEELREPLVQVGRETIAGAESSHYTLHQPSLGDWSDVEVDLWLGEATGAVLRYDLRATGTDPLFDAGEGVLSGQFRVTDVGPQTIDPVAGCEIDLPLPADAARLVKLPGLLAFESASTPDQTVAFYQAALAEAGWEPLAEPEVGVAAILLSYHRGRQTLQINVEPGNGGAHVELLLGEDR